MSNNENPPPSPPPSEVVSIIRHSVQPGHDAAYERWTEEVVPIAQTFPGHRGVAIVRPAPGTSTYTVVLHFDTLEHLQRWLTSDVRQHLLDRVQPHLRDAGSVEIKPGLDFWLSLPGQRRAPAFRQFLVALSAIYPLSLVVPLVLQPILDLSPVFTLPVVRALVVSIVIVWAMTYLIMPSYTRWIASWLYGEDRKERTKNKVAPPHGETRP